MNKIYIGINEQDQITIVECLKRLLSDSNTLYLQTHNFLWNVTGPQFRELQLMFEEHYTELATAVDVIAERIRTLDIPAPGTCKALAGLSNIREVDKVTPASEMVAILTRSYKQVVKTCRCAAAVLSISTAMNVLGLAGMGYRLYVSRDDECDYARQPEFC